MCDNISDKSNSFKNVSFITRRDSDTGLMSPHEGKRKVFISYKHSDESELPLCKIMAEYILEKLDVAIWYDRKLTAGEEYDEEIKTAIISSDVFVLMLTPNILKSKYVLDTEIQLAKKNQVAIIPVIAGISENDIPEIEKYVGRIHMPVWFFGRHTDAPKFDSDAKEQFFDGLKLCIANKDILEQTKLFYAKGSDRISVRHLNPEQMFIKAYGYFFDVAADGDKSIGIKLMESILNMYDFDTDFAHFQEQVAYELITHLYRINNPDLFFPYIRSALEKGYNKLLPLLFNVYRDRWNYNFLCSETELSLILFESLYRNNFGKVWDPDEVIECADKNIIDKTDEVISDAVHIGELHFDGHATYFQKSDTEVNTVNLIIDSKKVDSYDVYLSYGDVYTLFLAYDEERKIILVLHSDFDHYGPETNTRVKVYKTEPDGIHTYTAYSDWLKGLRKLPYSPCTFDIR